MTVQKSEKKGGVLTAEITASGEEFDRARLNAYRENTDRWPLPGIAPGEADLAQLQRTYGPAALYDEALDKMIPALFGQYLDERKIRVIGRPKVGDIAFEPDGGVTFVVNADCFPDVDPGNYRGIQVSADRGRDPDEFARQVMEKACSAMKTTIPETMIEQNLDAMTAQEKLRISQDAIYHLLADTLIYLKAGYRIAGVSRPAEQVREQGMDIMLSMVSFDNKTVPESYLVRQIGCEVGRYRDLPDDFEDQLRDAMEKRKQEKASMKPEDRIDEVFGAYLGSLRMTEAQWRDSKKTDAARQAATDLLLMKVAELEELTVSGEEIHEAYEKLAEKYGVDVEDIIREVHTDVMREQLLRDKARELILDFAEKASAKS